MGGSFLIAIVVLWAWWFPHSVGKWAASARQGYEKEMSKEEPRP